MDRKKRYLRGNIDKNKILKKVENRKTFAPNGAYLAGRYLREYKNQPI